MGQAEIQKVLEKQGDNWASTNQIIEGLKVEKNSHPPSGCRKISRSLRVMERFGEVQKKVEGRNYFWRLTERYKNHKDL